MKTALKTRWFGALRRSGVNAVVRNSEWRRRRLLILCYHGVSIRDEHGAWPDLYVPPALLRRRLEHLCAERYQLVGLDEGLRRLAAGTLAKRSVALTFDDGTRDFARAAVPLLREFGAPATVYPTTYYADRGQPIFDTALVYLLWRGRDASADWSAFAGDHAVPGLATHATRLATAAAIRRWAADRGLGADAKDVLLRRIAERAGVAYDAVLADGLFQVMSAAEMRALPHPLIDIQLHTHRHRLPDDAALLAREIADNRAYLAHARVPSSGVHFCYPNGESTPDAPARLRRLAVRSGVTCVPGIASPQTDPLDLPRFVDTTAVPDDTFDAWLSGTAQSVPRRRAVYRGRPAAASPPASELLDGLGLPPQEVHEHELA